MRDDAVRVAYYSPMPPSRSGIADYSALLVPALRERMDVELAAPGLDPDADVPVYHVGNDPDAHGWIVDALRRRSGVVVLHEFVLHHLVSGITLARGDVEGYLAALEREAGVLGRLLGHAVADGSILPLWETRATEFPLAAEVLDHASALVVHSRYLERRARDTGYTRPIHVVPMAAWPAPPAEPAAVDGAPLFGCFGHVNEAKRVPQLIEAFARLRTVFPDATLLIVGSWSERVAQIELPEGVVREDYVPEERLWSLMAACAAHVSLRYPTMGETSAAVVRSLSIGKPVVVNDVGWFSELPDDVAIKVAADDGEIDALVAALERLADPAEAARMGSAARALAETEHALGLVAERYAAVLAQELVHA